MCKANRSIAKGLWKPAPRKYNKTVRRLLAILLLSVIDFPLIAPAVSAQTEPELPPCCRIAGKHKCALKRAVRHGATGVSVSSIGDRCPFTPATRAVRSSLHAFPLNGVGAAFGKPSLVFINAAFAQPRLPATFDRAHYKRGPPRLLA